MKISQSQVSANSTGYEIKRTTRIESLSVSNIKSNQPVNSLNVQSDTLNISKTALNTNTAPSVKSCSNEETLGSENNNELKLILLELFIKNMTGKKVRLNRVTNIIPKNLTQRDSLQARQTAIQLPTINYELTEQHYESQSMTYSARAFVQTEDGKNWMYPLK